MRNFNKIARRFSDDMVRPEYKQCYKELMKSAEHLYKKGIEFRMDKWAWRSWEYCHLMQKIKRRDKIVMDFGGGNSLFSYHLAFLGHTVFMVDVDASSVDMFNKNIQKIKLSKKARGIRFNGIILPFHDGHFDLITFVSVIEHIPYHQRKGVFGELKRVLKPGKNLLMTFDYGKGGRPFGDSVTTLGGINREIVKLSGLKLKGNPFDRVKFDKKFGPPVKFVIPDESGMDEKVVQLSSGACCLLKEI
ncbi:MAG: class I SAM-dependent methyltransferase [Candidatus Omnitrophica bacterium]|nr:class I SAM-dependent methyltransferase [Candidatus Omnitrophota bacterium]